MQNLEKQTGPNFDILKFKVNYVNITTPIIIGSFFLTLWKTNLLPNSHEGYESKKYDVIWAETCWIIIFLLFPRESDSVPRVFRGDPGMQEKQCYQGYVSIYGSWPEIHDRLPITQHFFFSSRLRKKLWDNFEATWWPLSDFWRNVSLPCGQHNMAIFIGPESDHCSPVRYIDMTYRLSIYWPFWKISISISISIWSYLKISISISISIRQFCKISISIKYRIDSNLAYQTGLCVTHTLKVQ